MEFQIGKCKIAVKGFKMFSGAKSFTVVIVAPIGNHQIDVTIDYMENAVETLAVNAVVSKVGE